MNDDMLTSRSLFFEPPRRDRITAISGAVQRRPIVFVLGMHGSGASLCSHILSALGVEMADDIEPKAGDAGHWERREIAGFHDRILGLFNRDYDRLFHDFGLPVAWWADPRVTLIRREIVAFLETRLGEGYFGFKDPRAVRLMPVWHQILRELRLAPRVVLCLRNPAQIARSLSAREGLDPAIGEYRWLVHMIDFFRYANGLEFCTVEYDEWFDNPSANAEKLRKFLDLPWQQSEADLDLILSDIINPAARPDGSDHREASQPLVRTLYKLAGRAGQDGVRDQISYIVSQFVSFQQLQRPFLQAFEDVAQVAAKYPEIEHEATVLRAAVETAEHRANATEARLVDAVAKIEEQRTQIAEIARERDNHAEHARETGGLRATLAEREAASADLSRRADELLAALQVAQAELAQAERAGEERGVAAEAMQAEVATLQEALARAGEERGAAVTAIQAEAEELRDVLAQAERAGHEGAATADALRAEVIALWDTLAQAEHEALRFALAQVEREAQQRADGTRIFRAEVKALRETLAKVEHQGQERASAAAALQAEVMTLRDRLAQTELTERERAAVAVTLEAEVGVLRETLARAEGEAQERAATGAALQAEIVALQGTLTAARQVGKAAIAALQVSSGAPRKPDGRRGWRPATMRFFRRRDEFLNRVS
jgi:hypothetical protein